MVEHVKGCASAGWLRFAVAAGLLAVLAQSAVADNLRDPTVPPASLGMTPQSTGFVSSGPVLQSVMISPGRRVAVISGQAVKLGEKYGDSKVVKITESEVVLQGSGGSQILKLFPGVEKRVVSRPEQRAKHGSMRDSQ